MVVARLASDRAEAEGRSLREVSGRASALISS